MKKNWLILLILFVISYPAFSQQDEKIKASYMLAFGRPPFLSELNYWLGRGNVSVNQLLHFHRQGFIEFPELHKETIINSYTDVLGRYPSEDELKYWMNGNEMYIELVSDHLLLLKLNSWENEQVISLAFTAVLRRAPGKDEINFWKKQGTTPYFLLVAYLDYYKRNNMSKMENINHIKPIDLLPVSSVSVSSSIASSVLKYINQNGRGSKIAGRTIIHNGGTFIIAGKRNSTPNTSGS